MSLVARQVDPLLIEIDDLFTRAECIELIQRANAVINDDQGNRAWHYATTGGKYHRVIMKDYKLADVLWEKIKPLLPAEYNGHRFVYVNPVFRFSRYAPGGRFSIHTDGQNMDHGPHGDTISLFTLNIFLNDNFKGGSTTFFRNDRATVRHVVTPRVGRAALFDHNQYHQGDQVTEGHKFLIRTDVMIG